MRGDAPSATARLIALSTVFLGRHPLWRHLVPPLAAEASAWFLEAGPRPPHRLLRATQRRGFRSIVRAMERLTIPGILLHYGLRKRYLEAIARRALTEGCTQVVVFGAGYDTLALRLSAELPTVQFVEMDHPATQQVKVQALERRMRIGPNLRFLAADLARDRWAERLRSVPEYSRRGDTVFVADGLLMYLRSDHVDAVFRFIRDQSGPNSRFAFTFMEPLADGTIAFRDSSRLVAPWLWLRGEPFVWGVRRDQLATFLGSRGFSPRELATPDTLRARYLAGGVPADPCLADGEYISVAARLH
jgi:methyltransferase (TIGR00027 family)